MAAPYNREGKYNGIELSRERFQIVFVTTILGNFLYNRLIYLTINIYTV